MLPLGSYGTDTFSGAVGLRVGRADGIDEVGRVEHPRRNGAAPAIRRSLVVRGRLLTISGDGLESGDLATLAGRAWLALPGR